MTSRERMDRGLRVGMDGDFPVVIPYVGLFVRDHWEEFTDLPFWYPQFGSDAQQLAWMTDLLDSLPLDWLPVPLGTARQWFETHKVLRRDDRWILTDSSSGAETPIERPRAWRGGPASRRPLLRLRQPRRSAHPSSRHDRGGVRRSQPATGRRPSGPQVRRLAWQSSHSGHATVPGSRLPDVGPRARLQPHGRRKVGPRLMTLPYRCVTNPGGGLRAGRWHLGCELPHCNEQPACCGEGPAAPGARRGVV